MAEDKVLTFGVFVTDRCNRGCKHCAFKSTDKGRKYLQPEQIRKLVKEAEELGLKIVGSISGKGEPLMHRDLVRIAEAFVGLEICREIVLITSGFLEKDEHEKSLFQEFVSRFARNRLCVNFSFNMYASSFPERLTESLRVLFDNTDYSCSRIRVVCDCENFFETADKWMDLMTSLGTRLGMKWDEVLLDISGDPSFEVVKGELLSQSYSSEKEIWMEGISLLVPSFHELKSKKRGRHCLCVDTGMVSRKGRAKNFSNSCFFPTADYRCALVLGKSNVLSLYMDPEGNVFPSCDCVLGGLQIGTWETPLRELLSRKCVIRENFLRHVLLDADPRWNTEYQCEACLSLARKIFSFVDKLLE